MAHIEVSPYVFDCNACHTRCDGISVGVYKFVNDTIFAERYEQLVIDKINSSGKFLAYKTVEPGYPDIAVNTLDNNLHSYIEIKAQQRTFMSVERILPHSNLKPSETVALNLSDLLRYFTIQEETKIPTSIIWVVLNRPCITKQISPRFFYQTIDKLKVIYIQSAEKRRFRRRSGEGDFVNGEHKGVTVNYHFSLKELQLWQP